MGSYNRAIIITVIAASVTISGLSYVILQNPNQDDTVTNDAGGEMICGRDFLSWNQTSILDFNGFVTVSPAIEGTSDLIRGKETTGSRPGIYQFVLAPGSTGSITMIYRDFCGGDLKYPDDISSEALLEFFNSTNTTTDGLYKLGNNMVGVLHLPPSATKDIAIYVSSIVRENNDRVKVVYTASATDSADTGTYVMNIYAVCPGEILTIGENAYLGSIPWARETFYGCD